MEHLSYSTAGQGQPYVTAVPAPPHPPPPPGSLPLPPLPSLPLPTAAPMGVLPYGVEIPNRVFVGGCPFSMTDQQLGEFFSQYGTVKDSKIIADRGTGKSKGYGFVTFATEEEAASVHAMGSIFYNEKKLNLARAIRKCGGQFNHANQEYVNGHRAVYMHPNGYLIQQYDGNWHIEQYSPHSQPVKPCYPYLYHTPSAQPPPPFYVNNEGFSPVGNGETFFQNSCAKVSTTPPDMVSDTVETRAEKDSGTQSSHSSETATNKTDSSDQTEQLDEKLKQLSLDSAYTSEADLESSTNSTRRQSQDLESPTEEDDNENGTMPEPPDLSMIAVTRSPSMSRPPPQPTQQKKLANLPSLPQLPSPTSAANHGFYQPPAYFSPYTASFSYPYTPPMAIQTIGPVYTLNHN